jgi:nanoRNase/pAp phosphatase (c-di-AMP/oligoRNAs hydrolase)
MFGGGGHARAAGALIEGSLEAVRKKVVAAAREFLAMHDKDSDPAGEGAA